MESISSFSLQNNIDSEEPLSVNCIDKNKEKPNKCKYCGLQHLVRKCPAFGINCQKSGKLNHFKNVCKSYIKYERKVDKKEKDSSSVYSIIMNDLNRKL